MAELDTNSVLLSAFPSIDSELYEYIKGVLDCSRNEFESTENIYEAIGEVLHEIAGESKDENEIKAICSQLLTALKSGENDAIAPNQEHQTLNAPVHLGSMIQNLVEADEVSCISMIERKIVSYVDQKKLEKAETKLKVKRERRENVSVKPASHALINKEATAAQATNKKDYRSEVRGKNKSKDIKIENFDVAFGDQILLQGADMTLVYGRRYGLVGRNGIGKSTLLKMISSEQLKVPSHISILHVEQEVVGDDTIALESVLECDMKLQSLLASERKLLAEMDAEVSVSDESHLGMALQEIFAELEQIEADKAPSKASVILAGLGFTPQMQRKPTREFSGGWRMRIALARALFSKPDMLLLDEPTNMLDMKAIIWLENYLQTWKSTLLVVSHDRRFLDIVATDILHFHSKRIESYRGNYENFIKTKTEKLKHRQKEYEAQQQYRVHIQKFIDKYRAFASTAALVQSKIKMLEKLPDLKPVEKESVVVLRFPNPEYLEPPVLQLDEVCFSYAPTQLVLQNVDLSANMESRICIVGDNGSGKTTLLKLLTGVLAPTRGIRHCHRNLSIGFFAQHHVDQLDMAVSSVEFLARRFPGKSAEQYRRHLGCFGITGDLSLQSVASLSGGQKSRVAFAAMSMLKPNFLILDEPTNHLDVETIEALGTAMKNFKGGVILVSHNELLIEMVCQELWVCREGSVTTVSGGFSQYRKLVESELAVEL